MIDNFDLKRLFWRFSSPAISVLLQISLLYNYRNNDSFQTLVFDILIIYSFASAIEYVPFINSRLYKSYKEVRLFDSALVFIFIYCYVSKTVLTDVGLISVAILFLVSTTYFSKLFSLEFSDKFNDINFAIALAIIRPFFVWVVIMLYFFFNWPALLPLILIFIYLLIKEKYVIIFSDSNIVFLFLSFVSATFFIQDREYIKQVDGLSQVEVNYLILILNLILMFGNIISQSFKKVTIKFVRLFFSGMFILFFFFCFATMFYGYKIDILYLLIVYLVIAFVSRYNLKLQFDIPWSIVVIFLLGLLFKFYFAGYTFLIDILLFSLLLLIYYLRNGTAKYNSLGM